MLAQSPNSIGRGTVITFFDERDQLFNRAVALGSCVANPETSGSWLPLLRADCSVTLVGLDSIVDVSPAGTPGPIRADDPAGPVGVFARALGRLSDGLSWVDHTEAERMISVGILLNRFTHATESLEQALGLLIEADHTGDLAAVLACLTIAADEFAVGNLVDALRDTHTADAMMRQAVLRDRHDALSWYGRDLDHE